MAYLITSLAILGVVEAGLIFYLINRILLLRSEVDNLNKSVSQINDIIVQDWRSKVTPFNRPKSTR